MTLPSRSAWSLGRQPPCNCGPTGSSRPGRPSITLQPVTAASKCPFAGLASSDNDLSVLSALDPAQPLLPSGHGPGWTVLNPDQVEGLPPAQGRFCWNPLFGEALQVEAQGAGPFLLERYKEFGPVFTSQLGNQKVHSILDYDTIKSLLQHEGSVVKGWNTDAFYAILGENTRTQFEQPEVRMAVRKQMAAGFSPAALRSYTDKMVDIVSSHLEEWASLGVIDINKEGKAISFDFSTQLLVDFSVPPEQKQHLREKFELLLGAISALPIRLPGTRFSRGLAAKHELMQDIKALLPKLAGSSNIKGQQQQPGEDSSSSSEPAKSSVFEYSLGALKAMLDTDTLSDDDIAQTGITLTFAGNDQSGLGIMSVLALLPLVPELMDKVREEQHQVLVKYGPGFSPAALNAMPYTEAVIREALRVAPPLVGLFKKTMVPLEVAGKFIPAGSILHFSMMLAQLLTDPSLNPSADSTRPTAAADPWLQSVPADYFKLMSYETLKAEFNPDRWLAAPANSSANTAAGTDLSPKLAQSPLPPFSRKMESLNYWTGMELEHQPEVNPAAAEGQSQAEPGLMVFGAGPHVCLGQGLFMMETKVLVSLLARKYTLELQQPEELGFNFGFMPQIAGNGALLKVGRLA